MQLADAPARLRGIAVRVARFVAAPSFVIVAILTAGTCCAFVGVDMLAGRAWALIAAAVIFFCLAWLLLRGVARG